MRFIYRDLSKIKQTLKHCADTEHEQILLRIVVGFLMLAWFIGAPNTTYMSMDIRHFELTLMLIAGYIVANAITLLSVLNHFDINIYRRWAWVVIDPLFFCGIFYAAGQIAIPLLFVFVWLPIDNGFRYGSRYLFASLSGFIFVLSFVVSTERYWLNHIMLAVGVILNVLLLASYAAVLLGKLTEAKDKLLSMATRDALTNLPNRHLFMEHLGHAMAVTQRNGRYCSCIYIDLDGFKNINDTYGHAVADNLLIEVGKKITACLRDSDLVARLGGDEFAIAAQCFQVPTDAVMISQRVLQALHSIKQIDGNAISISASLGVSWYQYETHKGMTADRPIDLADTAMFAAKSSGKHCIEVVDQEGKVIDSGMWQAHLFRIPQGKVRI